MVPQLMGCNGVTGVIELRLVFEGGSHGHAVGVPAPVVKVLLAKAGFTDRLLRVAGTFHGSKCGVICKQESYWKF